MFVTKPNIEVREAVTAEERELVYRFRYKLYVEEMKRLQQYADHDKKEICEPLDRSGHVLAAYGDGDQLIGTVRLNVGADEHFGIYTDLYQLRKFIPFFPRHVSITTKLMVVASYRRSRLACQLAVACYRRALESGVCFDFIDCNPPLVKFFKHLGYRQTGELIRHPEYGDVVPLVLALHDLEHLLRVGSPFVDICKQFEDSKHSMEFFQDCGLFSGQAHLLTVAASSTSRDNEIWKL